MRFFIGISILFSFSATAKMPLNQFVTYEEYEELIQRCVSQIPEMKKIWEKNGDQTDTAFLGGDAVAGLLKYLDTMVRKYPFYQICRNHGPSLNFLRNHQKVTPKLFLGHGKEGSIHGWQTISYEYYNFMVQHGGVGIHTVLVNPFKVKDPHEALKDFYNGRLAFIDSPSRLNAETADKNSLPISITTQIVQWLTLLRQLNLAPAQEEQLEKIREIIERETPTFVSGEIINALTEFYLVSGKNIESMLLDLHAAGLAKNLILTGHVYVQSKDKKHSLIEKALKLKIITIDDLDEKTLEKIETSMQWLEGGETYLSAIQSAIPYAKNPKQVTQLLFPKLKQKTNNDNKERALYYQRAAYKFFEFNPTLDDLKEFGRRSNSYDATLFYIEMFARRSKSVRSFIDSFSALEGGLHGYVDLYRINLMPQFKFLNPSAAEITAMKKSCDEVECYIKYTQLALESAKNFTTVIEAIDLGDRAQKSAISLIREEYLQGIGLAIEKSFEKFKHLTPTVAELTEAVLKSPTIGVTKKLISEYFFVLKNTDDLEVIFNTLEKPTPDLKAEYNKICLLYARQIRTFYNDNDRFNQFLQKDWMEKNTQNVLRETRPYCHRLLIP